MKIYKMVILGILLILAAFGLVMSLPVFGGQYIVSLIALAVINVWFNWRYASGRWPDMSFLKAIGISLAMGAVGIYITALCFQNLPALEGYSVPDVLKLLLDRSPAIYIKPVILTPISLLIWRWLFKEPREAHYAALAAKADQ